MRKINGGNKLSADEAVQKIQSKLDELLEKVGLSETAKFINPHSKTALNLSHETMRQMSKEDLYEAAVLLKQYALKITIDVNRYETIINWCMGLLNDEVAQLINRQEISKTYNYDLLIASVARENDYARKVYKILKYYRAYKTQLDNVSWAITQQANTVENFAKGKTYG